MTAPAIYLLAGIFVALIAVLLFALVASCRRTRL